MWSRYEPPPTPLELQALQSRDYDEDKQVAFGSVMSVFQDLGYTPTSADLETGFITAESVATGNFDWIALLTDHQQHRADAGHRLHRGSRREGARCGSASSRCGARRPSKARPVGATGRYSILLFTRTRSSASNRPSSVRSGE